MLEPLLVLACAAREFGVPLHGVRISGNRRARSQDQTEAYTTSDVLVLYVQRSCHTVRDAGIEAAPPVVVNALMMYHSFHGMHSVLCSSFTSASHRLSGYVGLECRPSTYTSTLM